MKWTGFILLLGVTLFTNCGHRKMPLSFNVNTVSGMLPDTINRSADSIQKTKNGRGLHEGSLFLKICPDTFFLPMHKNEVGTLVIVNNTDCCYNYVGFQIIEIYDNDRWRTADYNDGIRERLYAVESGIFPLNAKRSIELIFNCRKDLYNYHAGEYRVARTMRNLDTKKDTTVYGFFVIMNNKY